MWFTEEDVLALYRRCDAVWFFDYEGDPMAPHAELTSGTCSDGYVNSALVMSDPVTAGVLADELVSRLREHHIKHVEWVVSSPYAAITFSYDVARRLDARHGFTEKHPTNPKRMLWERFQISADSTVLQCEELITTLDTTLKVRRAVQAGNPDPVQLLPLAATAIYRPPEVGLSGELEVVALVTRIIKTWESEGCPLCKQGSPRLRPKPNWRRLIDR